MLKDHSLHSHIRSVLTANGLVNGNAPFSTPAPTKNRSPLTDRQQNFARMITSTTSTAKQNLVGIRPLGLLGK